VTAPAGEAAAAAAAAAAPAAAAAAGGTTRQRRSQALFTKTGVTADKVLVPDSGGNAASKFRSSCDFLGAVVEAHGTPGARLVAAALATGTTLQFEDIALNPDINPYLVPRDGAIPHDGLRPAKKGDPEYIDPTEDNPHPE